MLQTVRLPFVRFVSEAIETKDPEGHIQFKNVYFAHITPAGGKDEVVKNADEWIQELKEKSLTRGPFDSAANEYEEWYRRFSKGLADFKAGEEMAVNGTPIRGSLAFTKAEKAQAEAAHLLSIEDLAVCNEEALHRMGIGARNLKIKAQKLLEGKAGADLALENEALRLKVEALEATVEKLQAAVQSQPAQRGRRAGAAADAQEASA